MATLSIKMNDRAINSSTVRISFVVYFHVPYITHLAVTGPANPLCYWLVVSRPKSTSFYKYSLKATQNRSFIFIIYCGDPV